MPNQDVTGPLTGQEKEFPGRGFVETELFLLVDTPELFLSRFGRIVPFLWGLSFFSPVAPSKIFSAPGINIFSPTSIWDGS